MCSIRQPEPALCCESRQSVARSQSQTGRKLKVGANSRVSDLRLEISEAKKAEGEEEGKIMGAKSSDLGRKRQRSLVTAKYAKYAKGRHSETRAVGLWDA